jgi:serine/threonine-protein kinase
MIDAADGSKFTLELPYRFGPSYLLFDRIGVGGMAEIYLARGKTRVGATRLAVVKLVLPALAGDSRFADMLIGEAKLAAQLSHANIVQTFDLGRESGRLYIAMEYVEGFDLNELLRRCTKAKLPLPPEFVFFVVGETLRALDYAHRRKDADGKPLGIVHRDVSPSNVLISFEGEVKLCDFGIARAMSLVGGDASAHGIEGKAAYMSPEHARGEVLDARADVFAAGIVLWELLAGRRLYKPQPGEDAMALARAGTVPELPDRGLPDHARLAAIVAKALNPDAAQRYPSALAFVKDLDAYAAENRLLASPLRMGAFLTDHFGTDIIAQRRARERAAAAVDQGPLVQISVVSFPPPADPLQVAEQSVPLHEQSAIRLRPPEEESAHEAPPAQTPATRSNAPASPAPAPRPSTPVGLIVASGLVIAAIAASVGWLLAHH